MLQQNQALATDKPSGPADHPNCEIAAKYVRLPNNQLGALLDHGASSAYAIHLTAHKIDRFNGPGLALNEAQVSKPVAEGGIEMGERKLRKGLALMRGQQILDRRKGGRLPNRKRAFAKETLAKGGDRYISLPETLVRSSDSKLVGFVAAVVLARLPQDARAVAKRIGVSPKSPNTINRLVLRALARQYIAAEHIGQHWIVARPGVNLAGFKNVAVQNVANHSLLKDGHRRLGTETQNTERESLPHATLAHASRGHEDEIVNEDTTKTLGSEWIELAADWSNTPYWEEMGRCCDKVGKEILPIAEWREWLAYFGGAPGSVATPAAHRQATEISHALSTLTGDKPRLVMQAFAFHVCKAHAAGKIIRSFGFIVERLARKADKGDDGWIYDLPSRIEAAAFDDAADLANKGTQALESFGIGATSRELLSTFQVESLEAMIRQHGRGWVVAGINRLTSRKKSAGTLAPELEDDESICGWRFFDKWIAAAKADAKQQAQTVAKKSDWRTNHAAFKASRAQHIAARQARHAELQKVAEAGIVFLRERGKEVDTHRLQIRSQLDDLSNRLARNVEPIELLRASVLRWLAINPERTTVTAWSNIGWAIRDELAARQQRAA